MHPNYLFTPSHSIIEPPISTTVQELPIEKLTWEDFEKLCLALIQIDFSIDDCSFYGIKGQAQHGIDIYARQANGKLSTYQCKRYQDIAIKDLNEIIETFRRGKFFSQSDRFHICTSSELSKTQVSDRFETLKTKLEAEGLQLIKWDKIQLSRHLKKHPQIVHDFFGTEWVKRFNGEAALDELSSSKRLDAAQVIFFRKKLHDFYSTIFNIQDPGIPVKEINHPYKIQDRFILPDIISAIDRDQWQNPIEDSANLNFISEIEYNQYDYATLFNDEEKTISYLRKKQSNELSESNWNDIRTNVDEALSVSTKNIVIGDPGAGKSTLLRFIVLDILNTSPQLENISKKFGNLLPVWLPFAFITKHLNQDDTLSISEILRLWFKSYDKEALYEVAKEALEDERLFLVIDGIDEWNNFASAQLALSKIETARNLFDCKILYSSRPFGFRMLKDHFTDLKILHLAGFSNLQQKQFIENWYGKWNSLQSLDSETDFSILQSENFIKELNQTGELKKLAETPLLLSILIIQKLRDSILPKNRLEALKDITQYLINKHPVKRHNDAAIIQDPHPEIDFKEIFCELAIQIQIQSNDGVILKVDAQRAIQNYLIQYADYDKAKAKLRSRELLDVGANNFGIIVEKSADEIAFSHKQFQEYLAAQYLFESDHEYTDRFLTDYGANPTFHQVFIYLFGLIPQRQTMKYIEFYGLLCNAAHKPYEANYLRLISYEVAINMENAPTEIINNGFQAIIQEFEFETDPMYKEALLRRLLAAIDNGRIRDKVYEFLVQYFPNEIKYRDYRIISFRKRDKLLPYHVEFLKKAMINSPTLVKYDASVTLRKHIKQADVFKLVHDLILKCDNSHILAFAINSVITSDLDRQKIEPAIATVKDSSSIVKLFLFKYKVSINEHVAEDLEKILSFINDISYEIRDEAINLLIDGYGESKVLMKRLLKSISDDKRNRREKNVDLEISWKVLFHCFNSDQEVVDAVNREFGEEYPFSTADSHMMFRHMSFYFKGRENEIPNAATWLTERLAKYSHIDNDVAFLSIFVHNEESKTNLLSDLPDSGISHWHVMALLEGWPEDEAIRSELKEYFRSGETEKIAAASHFVPTLFADEKEEAVSILEKVLFAAKNSYRERAIAPLIEIDKEHFEKKLLSKILAEIESFPKDMFMNSYYNAAEDIVKNFHTNASVRSFVFENAGKDRQLYDIASPYFTELEQEFNALNKSIPLAANLRRIIIEKFNDLTVLPDVATAAFSRFPQEAQEGIRGDMAICLFNSLKKKDPDRIIELCHEFAFARGFDHDIQRNIAFSGYLISNQLETYLKLRDEYGRKAYPQNLFTNRIWHRSSSPLMISSLVENFDYLISASENDPTKFVDRASDRNSEELWTFFAMRSTKSSPTYPYIIDYITKNEKTLRSSSMLSFLNRTSPKSTLFKNILMNSIEHSLFNDRVYIGRLLGINFNNDTQVYNTVSGIKDFYDEIKILALCTGWPHDPILKSLFEKLIKTESFDAPYSVIYSLKFLFRDVKNIMDFLCEVLSNQNEIEHLHKYFIFPLLERLRKDDNLKKEVKKQLLASTTASQKISYYNLLSHVNWIDGDIQIWKTQIAKFQNDYGYDILTNKTVRLKDILYDYYF